MSKKARKKSSKFSRENKRVHCRSKGSCPPPKHMTRPQVLKKLQVSVPLFRRLCILKGIFPRDPKKKFKGNHHTYYHTKDIAFINYEPLLDKFREMKSYDKKIRKAHAYKNPKLAHLLATRKPDYTLDRLIRERYPTFIDALRDLDDCLTLVHLFAALTPTERQKIDVTHINNCRRLSHEWQAYISRTHKLRKTFISVKGIYYEAEVDGQKITWLTPHALQQVLTDDIEYSVMLTFLDFYKTLLSFVNFKLYHSINVKYPPILDHNLEALAADVYMLSRYVDANTKGLVGDSEEGGKTEVRSETDNDIEGVEELQTRKSEHDLLPKQSQLIFSKPGALVNLIEDASKDDVDDKDTLACRLFRNFVFFLARETPRESLLFVIPAFGGEVSWEGEGTPFNETDQKITHQIVDRPTQGHKFLSREYVQPQWVYDCINAGIILPTELYLVGRIPPPHLSPFVDNDKEGHIPEYAEVIKRMQVAARNELLPLPGLGNEDLVDPQNLLVEGVISRVEAIEAAEKKLKLTIEERRFHNELNKELHGGENVEPISNIDDDVEEVARNEVALDMKQITTDVESMSKIMMPRKKRMLAEAIEIGRDKKKSHVRLLKRRKKKIEEGSSR